MVRKLGPPIAVAIVLVAIVYAGWLTLGTSSSGLACSVCERPIHLASRVDAIEGEKELSFCCGACALRAKGQGGDDLRIIRVFDYESGRALEPEAATALVGSDVNLCMREHVLMDAHKEARDLHFDRCSPGVLAFASSESAERFRAEHGGTVKPFAELEGATE